MLERFHTGFPWKAFRCRSALLWSAILCCAGCGTLGQDLISWRKGPADACVEEAAALLLTDQWRLNPVWSPLNDDERFVAWGAIRSKQRWSHPSAAKVLDLLGRVDGESAAEAAAGGPPEQGLGAGLDQSRHVSGGEVLPDASNAVPVVDANARFALLVRQKDLTGWNAAILWAHHDPRAASEAAPLLAKLVVNPPVFHPRAMNPPVATPGAKAAAPRKSVATKISMNMRAAAAEAWCLVLAAAPEDRELAMAPAGNALLAEDLANEIRGELMRGIARQVPPDQIPGLADALRTETDQAETGKAGPPPSLELRRAAVEACVAHAINHREPRKAGEGLEAGDAPKLEEIPDKESDAGEEEEEFSPWPRELWSLQWDPDARIRQRFGEWLAVVAPPRAFKVLKAQLTDQETKVRDAAFVSLGLLATPEAKAELHAQAQRPEERIRMFAVRGLSVQTSCAKEDPLGNTASAVPAAVPAAVQAEKALSPFVKDKSAIVRAEVARCLRSQQNFESTRLIGPLLADASLDVQRAALATIAEWKSELAVPLLLQSLAESSLKTRKAALIQLEKRRGVPLTFPLDGNPHQRIKQVEQWSLAWGLPDPVLSGFQTMSNSAPARLDAMRVAEVRERLAALPLDALNNENPAAADWFTRLTAADLPSLERATETADAARREFLLRNVLPRLNPAYAALHRLADGDVSLRRQGAQTLGQLGSANSLSPVLVRTLHSRMRQEQDKLVWRYVMQGILKDSSDEAAQLALLAVNHAWPDIRLLGCEYIAWHGRSPHGVWIMPLLHDASKPVQLAAVIAAGKCRNPLALDGLSPADGNSDRKGLRPLLNEPQGQLRFAVIVSMSQIGDPQAMEELVRLSFDNNPAVRADVVHAMGETGQTRFIEALVRLAWTETSYNVKSAAVAGLRKLVPSDEHPARLNQALTLDETVTLWVSWWESRKTRQQLGDISNGISVRSERPHE